MMNYKIIERENPLNRAEKQFYPAPVWSAQLSEDELAEDISFACSVNISDIRAVISSLIELLPRKLMAGNTVKLGDFGIFRLSFESIGSAKAEDVSASNIQKSKILFRPSSKIKNKISQTSFRLK